MLQWFDAQNATSAEVVGYVRKQQHDALSGCHLELDA